MNMRRGASRMHLLTTVSTVALITSLWAGGPALAAGSGDEPPLWIELGSHAYTVNDSDNFALPFGSTLPPLTGPLVDGLLLSREFGDDGKITYRPEGTNWVFSAGVTYGRSRGKGGTVRQTQPLPTTSVTYDLSYIPSSPFGSTSRTHPAKITANSIDADTIDSESHLMIDFAVGKDVGLGLFGRGSTSTLSAGVRFGQLNSQVKIARFSAVPDAHLSSFHTSYPTSFGFTKIIDGSHQVWHSLSGSAQSWHRFTGVGPSIAWNASAPLTGHSQEEGISLDWGINFALLFGKQKNKVQHDTSVAGNCYMGFCPPNSHYKDTSQSENTKTITVPNLGGFAGLSYRVEDVKISLGYRADFFFHALDTGVAGQHADTRGYYGPFASLSFGLGD